MNNVLKVFCSLRVGALSVALALCGTAFVQAKDVSPKRNCHCIVPAGSTGKVLSSSGDVQVSGTHGFSPAEPGTELAQGSLIIVGLRSGADIVFGGCHLNILPMRDVSLKKVDGGICVRTKSADGLIAGVEPTTTSTLRTLSATFPKATGSAAASTTTTTAGAAGGSVADEENGKLPIVAIVAGVAAVGAFVAIAASDSDSVSP